jgi:hypothetical protein
MEIVFVKLLIAHLLGDFFLQPNSWVKEKEEQKLKSPKLYIHVAIHIALIFIIFGALDIWRLALIIGFSHFIIDAGKLVFQRAGNKRLFFFLDQILHLAVILFLCYGEGIVNLNFIYSENFWWIALGALFLTSPSAIIIKVVIDKFIPSKSSLTLQNAGKFIGILERLLIFVFIITGHFEAVGFLLAAKSIFRFGDLKEATEVRLTEYVLIGTLLSFGIAVVVSLLINQLLMF